MTKNSKYVMAKIIDPKGLAKPAQVGVDLTIDKMYYVCSEIYEKRMSDSDRTIKVYKDITLDENSKIQNFEYKELEEDEDGYFYLEPHTSYQVKFDQGLVPLLPNENARICARSSLNRVGVQVLGVIFDPGYGIDASDTDGIGCALYTFDNGIKIHRHSRIAQIQIFENEPVDDEDLYNGRWQGTNKT